MEEEQESQPSSPREGGDVEDQNKGNEEVREEEERNSHPSPNLHHHTQARSVGSYSSVFGKHRMQAATSNLNNQIHALEKELQQVETFGKSSAVCIELVSTVESQPDPLLPLTTSPVDVSWDRWFAGAHHSRSHKRWR